MATGSRTTPALPVTDDSSPHCVERWDGGRDIPVDAHQMRPEPGGDRWSLPVAARHRTPLGQGLSAIAGDQRDRQVVHPHGTRAGTADVAGRSAHADRGAFHPRFECWAVSDEVAMAHPHGRAKALAVTLQGKRCRDAKPLSTSLAKACRNCGQPCHARTPIHRKGPIAAVELPRHAASPVGTRYFIFSTSGSTQVRSK
jgi:hypothetical protein